MGILRPLTVITRREVAEFERKFLGYKISVVGGNHCCRKWLILVEAMQRILRWSLEHLTPLFKNVHLNVPKSFHCAPSSYTVELLGLYVWLRGSSIINVSKRRNLTIKLTVKTKLLMLPTKNISKYTHQKPETGHPFYQCDFHCFPSFSLTLAFPTECFPRTVTPVLCS